MDAKQLGSNIQKYRRLKEMTQESVAEKCGLSTNYFRQIELGNKVPRLETFLKIAEVLDTSSDLLFSGILGAANTAVSNELYEKVKDLPANQQEYILSTVDSMVDGIKKL